MRLEYFQMIDRFVELKPDERKIKALCKVPTESPVFEGHFPGFALMPGVLLIECMAQTTGWLVSVVTGFVGLPLLVGVKDAKIKGIVLPGTELTFDGAIIHEGSGYAIAEAKGYSNGKSVCEARLTFSLTPYPNEEFRKIMIEMGHKVGISVEEHTK
jgi:3-hydroxyacyl-[acyl-carrier-protein] dehydratase